MRKTILTRTVVVAALLATIGSFAVVESQNEWGPAKSAYDDYIKRPSLQMRTRGRIKLAETRHPGAWDILSKSYAKPEDPKDQVSYLLTTICAQYFADEEYVDKWATWRNGFKKPQDAWLWYRSLLIHQDYRGEDDLIAVASDSKNDVFLRTAAIEALNTNGSEKLIPWWITELDKAEKEWKGIERILMLEAAANTFLKEGHQLGSDDFRNFGLKLIPLIEHKLTDERTKLIMGRCFKEVFSSPRLYVNKEPWLQMLLNPSAPVQPDPKYAPPTPPTRFVGVEAHGKRIVYVIDLSDSMLNPVSAREKEEIKKPPAPKGPVTGEPGKHDPDAGKVKEDEKEAEKDPDLADELPWDKIRTRFDVAREYLKLSLRSLQPDQHYCVIMFVTTAEPARSTRGLTPVTPAAINATIKELDGIRAGPGTATRKLGTLRGDTNLHGGIHRAFKVKKGGMVKEYEYVDASTFTEGADTVFILSDGDPTDDDWAINDKRDPWDQTGDPETRIKAPDQDVLRFPGPYGYMYQSTYLPDDVRRLNLFRRCEIHCIGIGEASQSLLSAIARWGNGQVKFVGAGGG